MIDKPYQNVKLFLRHFSGWLDQGVIDAVSKGGYQDSTSIERSQEAFKCH